MWGTTATSDELTDNFGGALEGTSIAWLAFSRKISRKPFLDFCNTICQEATPRAEEAAN
jgi:hypothetical protein